MSVPDPGPQRPAARPATRSPSDPAVRAITAPPGRLPLHEALDAFEAWERRPAPATLARLQEALGRIAELNGMAGAYLVVDAEPLPAVHIGTGTLRRRPAARRRDALHEQPLIAAEGRTLGRLWLDPGVGGSPDAGTAQAARAIEVALDAAWSRARTRAAEAELSALDAASRAVAGVLSLERVFQLIVDRVRELAGAEYAALGIVDQEGQIERFITSGISRHDRERIGPPPRGHGLLGLIIREGQTFRVDDIARDERRYGFPPNHPEMHAFLGVPITVKGRSIGDLYLTNKRGGRPFSADDQRLVEMFALHAGIAMENARLHEQVQRLAIVEERERIGRDLHDGIIQSIYAVGLGLEDVADLMDDEPAEAKARVERAIDALDQTIRDIRNFIFGLRPELLEQAGLVGGLAALGDEFRVNSLVDVELEAEGDGLLELPADETTQLLSIAREALSNIARHSKATRAAIKVAADEDAVSLDISDNGVGFDPARPRGPGHQGLVNMRARAADVGGSLEVVSRPGHGTRIIVQLPRPGPDRAAEVPA
ncbi:MAG TPA: GAF domain-containing sensor histidine kinase [Candidatus Limnocylindrales bacterium]